MSIVKVLSKGQITLPKAIRDKLEIRRGNAKIITGDPEFSPLIECEIIWVIATSSRRRSTNHQTISH